MSRRVLVNLSLYVVVLVAAALLVVAAVRVAGGRDTPTALPVHGEVALKEGSSTEQARYAAIIDAASAEATAFTNIRYDDAQASIDKVMAGATGDFKDQYAKATDALIKLLTDNKSIRSGQVVWTGVVAQDQDSATVIIATVGTVSNNATKNQEQAENYRLQLQLTNEKGTWLTSDLQFVA